MLEQDTRLFDEAAQSASNRRRHFLIGPLAIATAVIVLPLGLPETARAQGAQALLEEITVTARRRDEALQDVPVAVTAFTGDQLTALGVKESGDIAALTPNFTWRTEFGRATPQPFLRGVGSNGFMPNNQNPIAVYVDDVLIGPNIAQGFASFDIERVEVLKGPQGTLYGRNATAGLISFISRKPVVGGGTEGFVRLEVGDYGTFNSEAAIEFDMGETAAARIAATTNKNDGFYDNLNLGGQSGRIDDVAARVQLLFQPNENLDILVNGHFGDASPDVAPFKAIGTICPPGVTVPNLNDCTAGAGKDSPDLFEVFSGPTIEEVETAGGFFRLAYRFDEYELTSISAFENSELRRMDDVDDLAAFQEYDHFDDEFDTFSQEIRLSGGGVGSTWQVGAFYYNEDYEGEIFADFVVGAVSNHKEIETRSLGLYGQVDVDLTDRSGITFGLRYTNEEKDVDYSAFFSTGNLDANFYGGDVRNNPDITILDRQDNVLTGRDFDNISGRLSYNFRATDTTLLYLSYARGFKAGDVNGVAFSTGSREELAVQASVTEPEILDAFEIGLKSDFETVRFNAAIFHYDYQDVAQSILQPVPGFPVPVTSFQNAASSKIPGAEVDVIWGASENFTLLANLGYVDAEYDEYPGFEGNRVPLTADFEGNLMGIYDIDFSGGGALRLQADVQYVGEIFFQPSNEPALSEDAQTVWNAAITYLSANERWDFRVFAKNLTDEQYFISGFNFDVPGIDSLHAKPNLPRYVGASFQYRFGGN